MNDYITRTEFENRIKFVEKDIERLNDRINDLDKSITRQFSFWGIATGVFAISMAAVIFLASHFMNLH